MKRETELEMVTRHVREGLATLSRQREVIERLRALGHATNEAEQLLAKFELSQAAHEAHLARLKNVV